MYKLEYIKYVFSLSDFCTVDGEEQALWQRVTSYAQDMYAMKDVFAMDSTVRVDAIENLGKFLSLLCT